MTYIRLTELDHIIAQNNIHITLPYEFIYTRCLVSLNPVQYSLILEPIA